MKSLQKLITSVLILILITASTAYLPVGAQGLPLEQITQAEIILFGQASGLAIKERIEQLEYALFNEHGQGSLIDRSDRIIQFVLPTADHPSLAFLLNALEWTLTNQINQGNIMYRLSALEKAVFGQIQKGALVNRINELKELSLTEDSVVQKEVRIPLGTVMKVKLNEVVNSGKLERGNQIEFIVEQDLQIEDALLVSAGTLGKMEVIEVKQASRFGKDGQVVLGNASLVAIDGSVLSLRPVFRDDDTYSQEIAVGIGLLGTVILSNPIGLLAGLIYEGKEDVIPAETKFKVMTLEEVTISGLSLY